MLLSGLGFLGLAARRRLRERVPAVLAADRNATAQVRVMFKAAPGDALANRNTPKPSTMASGASMKVV